MKEPTTSNRTPLRRSPTVRINSDSPRFLYSVANLPPYGFVSTTIVLLRYGTPFLTGQVCAEGDNIPSIRRTLDCRLPPLLRRRGSRKGRFEGPPHQIGHEFGAAGVGMNAVSLVQRRDAVEEERNQLHLVSLGEASVDGAELVRVLRPVVRRCFHAGKDDGHFSGSRPIQNAREILFQLRRRESAKPIIAAEGYDKQTHV